MSKLHTYLKLFRFQLLFFSFSNGFLIKDTEALKIRIMCWKRALAAKYLKPSEKSGNGKQRKIKESDRMVLDIFYSNETLGKTFKVSEFLR